MELSWASFITPEGIIVAAGLVNRLVQVLKTVSPTLDRRVSGALLSFIASGVLYLITAAVIATADPNLLLTTFAAWLSVAGGSIGINSVIKHVDEQPLKKAATNDAIDLEGEIGN